MQTLLDLNQFQRLDYARDGAGHADMAQNDKFVDLDCRGACLPRAKTR